MVFYHSTLTPRFGALFTVKGVYQLKPAARKKQTDTIELTGNRRQETLENLYTTLQKIQTNKRHILQPLWAFFQKHDPDKGENFLPLYSPSTNGDGSVLQISTGKTSDLIYTAHQGKTPKIKREAEQELATQKPYRVDIFIKSSGQYEFKLVKA